MLMKLRDLFPVIFLASLLLLVIAVYSPGLRGGFLFDDYPNLEELGTYGGVVNFETFKNFVFNGVASPLGRPLALASFLLDDNTWPTRAEWFKSTNLKIHLLTGLFLCWASLNLMRLFGRKEIESIWIALLSSAIWLLHPYMLSTTLYVVQRMAQLAAMFVFAGLAGYLHGRILLLRGELLRGYLWMSFSLGIATLLALTSKENGVLLPMLVLVIHGCLPKALPPVWFWWRVVFLWLPSIAIIAMLAKEINFSPDAWPNRPFTQPERLLTEPRILWEYLYQLYVPKIEGRGLFQDGYAFSHGFFEPVSTSIAIISLFLLIIAAIFLRSRFPLVSLGILFYLVAHIIESSVVGLELYFEHRNYLASAFLFLPISAALVGLKDKIDIKIIIASGFMILLILSFLTWQRAKLWSNTVNLELYWAASTPESPRAQNKIGSHMLRAGHVTESISFMSDAVKRFPNSSLLTTNLLLIKVYVELAEDVDFREASERLKRQPFDAQAVVGLRHLVDFIGKAKSSEQYATAMLSLLSAMESNVSYNRFYLFNKLVPYLNAKLYLILGDYDKAYQEFSRAISMYRETDSALSMVAEMANAGRPVEAMMLFKESEGIYKAQPTKTLKRSRELYDKEFIRMRNNLDDNLKAIGINSVVDVPHSSSGEEKNAEHNNSGKE